MKKNITIFVSGFILGMFTLYIILWGVAIAALDKAWCKIYTGETTPQRIEHCKNIK